MDGGTVAVKMVRNSNFNIIPPTCPNPRAGVSPIEDFTLIILASIRIERHACDIERILACNAFGVDVLIVRMDIVPYQRGSRIYRSKPATLVLRAMAGYVAGQFRVPAFEIGVVIWSIRRHKDGIILLL
jgi:hypothetical protein